MTTYDLKTAKRISFFGAKKMSDAGYCYTISPANPNVFKVYQPGAEVGGNTGFYFVQLETPNQELHCFCPFFRENSYCKHCLWIQWEEDARKEREAREEEEAWARAEALETLEQ
ncbi:MAG: hypothetical protein V4671_11155 [Armatimonadota bacterium]